MSFITIVGIALGLAMDAFAVSITSGLTIRCLRIRHALRISLFFGGFQAVMPVIGWLAGLSLRDRLSMYDHWIAFALLCVIGLKMIVESLKMDGEKKGCKTLDLGTLLLLSIATSIDALVIGITFAFLGVSILLPIAVIGIITFLLSFAGVYIGERLGHFFEKKIEIAGGLVLIGMGIKILIQHAP